MTAGSPAARAAANSPYGINIHVPQGPELAAQLNRVTAAKIGWVRIDFIWAVVQPAAGTWDWHPLRCHRQRRQRAGNQGLRHLAYTPAWATDGPELSGVPRNPNDWVNFCYQAAQAVSPYHHRLGDVERAQSVPLLGGGREDYVDFILRPGAPRHPCRQPRPPKWGALTSPTSPPATPTGYDWLRLTLLEAGDDLVHHHHHVYDSDGSRA